MTPGVLPLVSLLLTLVDALTVAPRLRLDIRYATRDNFTHQRLRRAACQLRAPVAARLAEVQRELAARGLGLLVYDCYRPLSVQRLMWRLVPNPDYVADPHVGSRHNRGAAVDLTLVDQRGRPLPMPSPYDEFSPRAHRDFAGGSARERQNRALLEEVMARHGFVGLPPNGGTSTRPNGPATRSATSHCDVIWSFGEDDRRLAQSGPGARLRPRSAAAKRPAPGDRPRHRLFAGAAARGCRSVLHRPRAARR